MIALPPGSSHRSLSKKSCIYSATHCMPQFLFAGKTSSEYLQNLCFYLCSYHPSAFHLLSIKRHIFQSLIEYCLEMLSGIEFITYCQFQLLIGMLYYTISKLAFPFSFKEKEKAEASPVFIMNCDCVRKDLFSRSNF